MADFKDFDAASREVEDREVKFQVGGENFAANLNVNAGKMLKWMASGSKIEAIPNMLLALMDKDEYDRLVNVLEEQDIDFSVLAEIVVWLAEEMGSSGN